MWALQRLRKLLTTEYGQSININRMLGDSEGEARPMVSTVLSNKLKTLTQLVQLGCAHITISITDLLFPLSNPNWSRQIAANPEPCADPGFLWAWECLL